MGNFSSSLLFPFYTPPFLLSAYQRQGGRSVTLRCLPASGPRPSLSASVSLDSTYQRLRWLYVVCLCIIASIIVASSKKRANILHLVTIVIVHWHLERCRACSRRLSVAQTAVSYTLSSANSQQCAVYSDTPLEVPSLKTRLTEKVTRTEVEVLIPSRDEALEPTHLWCVFYHTCNRAE